MGWRGRTVGRGHSSVGGGRSEGHPPNFLLPGALGTFRPQERLSRRRRSPQRLVGRVGKRLLPAPRRGPAAPGGSRRLPAEPLPPPCSVPAPLGASCAPLEEVGKTGMTKALRCWLCMGPGWLKKKKKTQERIGGRK